MPTESGTKAIVRVQKELVLAMLFQAAGPLAAEILRQDSDLDPAVEGDPQGAFERAIDAVLSEFGKRNPRWSGDSVEPAIEKVLDHLLDRT